MASYECPPCEDSTRHARIKMYDLMRFLPVAPTEEQGMIRSLMVAQQAKLSAEDFEMLHLRFCRRIAGGC